MVLLGLLATRQALAQTLEELRRSAQGVPAVWRATVSGDLNLQLGGPGRIHVVRTQGGGHIVTLHLTDEARQLRQPMGSGVLINGLYTNDPESGSLPLNLGPFDDLHVPGRGRLALETAIEPRVRVSVTSGAFQVHRLEGSFEASFSGTLEQAGTPRPMRTISRSTIEGQVCQVAEADMGRSWHEVDCFEPGEYFFVEQFEPEHRRENVDYDRPPLIMSFSESVRAADLQEHFSLHTRSRSGTRIPVDGRVRAQAADRLVFEPDQALRPGVIYEARIAGGERGLRSRGGATLEADHSWRFSTIVNLDQQSQAENGPLDPNVFQTARNAALVPGKPTMTRLTVDWQEHDDIDPAWQVTSFPALVEVSHPHARIVDHSGRYTAEGEATRVIRPDRFNDEDRRMARNTINFFGWFPSRFDPSTEVTAALEPYDPYPARRAEPIRFEGERAVSIWAHEPHLRFHYARVLIGDWEDGVPPEDVAAIRSVVRAAEIFATQTLPVVNARGINSIADLTVNLSDRWGGDHESRLVQAKDIVSDTFQWNHYHARVLERVIKYAHDRMLGHLAPTDIFADFHPLLTSRRDQVLDWGQAISGVYDLHPMELDGTPYRYRTVRLPIQHNLATRRLSHGLVHEFGHTFGLHHHPANASEMNEARLWAPGRSAGIEGFRLAPSGLTGWNKSATEGNAESPYHLAPLMWPDARDEREIFILNAHYEQVKRVVEREANLWGFRHQPAWFASIDFDSAHGYREADASWGMLSSSHGSAHVHNVPSVSSASAMQTARATSYRVIIGALRSDGSEARIASIHRTQRPLEADDGPFLAELQDAAGRVLSAVRFGGQSDGALDQHREAIVDLLGPDDPLIWPYFSVSLPDDPRAHRVVIRHGDLVIAERSRAEVLPDARLDVPEGFLLDGSMRLSWQVAQGTPRHFDLLYSPDGAEPWQVLRFESTATEAYIDAQKLHPGVFPPFG